MIKSSRILRPRKSLFYVKVPGSDPRKLESSLKSKSDVICYDLEDSVSIHQKENARQYVFKALEQHQIGTREKAVRINSIDSPFFYKDLSILLNSPYLTTLVIPKVHSHLDMNYLSQTLKKMGCTRDVSELILIPCIESAKGIVNLERICESDDRIQSLVFAAEDYAADVGLIRSESIKEMLYARQKVVTVASAFELQSIDLVCVDYKNNPKLEKECREGMEFGFTGKQAIHPNQVDTIQTYFSPLEADVERATKIMKAYQENLLKGIGAFTVDDKMVDMPVVKWAQRLLNRI